MSHDIITSPFPGVEAHPGTGHYGVYDYGAHVYAWQPQGERPVLWMSAKSMYEAGQPLRGGVPVAFPWFGMGAQGALKPVHGFARLYPWNRYYVDDTIDHNGRLVVEYQLDRTKIEQQPHFPHAFMAMLRVIFTPDYLQIGLKVNNAGDEPFTFEEALHTYIAVGDARHVSIEGLEGKSYLERAGGVSIPNCVQDGAVQITAETDRIYRHQGTVVLDDPTWGRKLHVSKEGSANTVVWNPWIAKAEAMPDFGNDEWMGMICIEAANVLDNAITLAPGETHLMRQRLSLVGVQPTL